MIVEPLPLKVPLVKTAGPAKVIGVPDKVTAAAVLLTVKVPVGMVPAVRVAPVPPSMLILILPLAPSLVGVTLPEAFKVPPLMIQLDPQPAKAARLRVPPMSQVPVTVLVPARFPPAPFSNLKVTLLKVAVLGVRD